jgi:prolyl-tRNA synthetase
MKNFCVGANKEGYHYINCNVKDISYTTVGDISTVVEGDICPNCGGRFYFKKGIEIGNTFKLGKHYAEDLKLTYLDEEGNAQTPTMGCYGKGPGRVFRAHGKTG